MSSTPGKIVLHGTEMSPPVRAVLLTLKALELDYEFREVDLMAGEHKTPEYLAKNPQHTVPLLEDVDGRPLWDSHAICTFLVRKYGRADEAKAALYPSDWHERAVVDQRLFYEAGVLFATCLRRTVRDLMRDRITEVPADTLAEIHEAYSLLETFLADHRYLAGARPTLADFSCVATVSSLHLAFAPVDVAQWPRLSTWLTRMAQLPYYEEANGRGARSLAEFLRPRLPKQFDKLWHKALADIKSGRL